MVMAAACAGPSSSLAPNPPSSIPSPSVSAAAGSASAPSPSASETLVIEDSRGLIVTLPPEWLAIGSADAKDAAKLATLRAVSSDQATRVDSLVDALQKHPEYWLAAMRHSDQAVITAQVREFADFDIWSSEQKAALEKAYGQVESTVVSTPREGVLFSWTNNGIESRLYGFKRPGGAVLFSFGGRAGTDASQGWEEAIATFTDTGL
jgi:hypothetical protein